MRNLLKCILLIMTINCQGKIEENFNGNTLDLTRLSFRCKVNLSSTGSINSKNSNLETGKMTISNSNDSIEFIFASEGKNYFVTYANQRNPIALFGLENSVHGNRLTFYEELRGLNDSKQNGKMQYYIITGEGKFIWMKYSAFKENDSAVYGLGTCDTIY